MWKTIILLLCASFSMTLCAKPTVLAFAGSTRAESVNKKLAREAARIAGELGADVEFIDLKDYPIPFYDGDLETTKGMPENVKYIRNLMIKSQVILVASPEYNGSLSALLKNTLDWASRSEAGKPSRQAFKGKKFIIMSASPGRGGGAGGLAHLRDILKDVGGVVDPQVISVGNAYSAFDVEGRLKDPKLQGELQKLLKGAIQ